MRRIVVNASVAAKWVVEEAHSAEAALLLQCEARHAPGHWLAEAVNVLWSKFTKGDFTAGEAEERMVVLLRAPVIAAPVADLMPRAFAIATAHRVTIYDSLYVALAERLNIPLVTADERLLRRMVGDPELHRRMVWVGDVSVE